MVNLRLDFLRSEYLLDDSFFVYEIGGTERPNRPMATGNLLAPASKRLQKLGGRVSDKRELLCFSLLQHHQKSAGRYQNTSYRALYGDTFMKEDHSKDNGYDDAHLVDRYDLRGIPYLQSLEIAKPRCAGSES